MRRFFGDELKVIQQDQYFNWKDVIQLQSTQYNPRYDETGNYKDLDVGNGWHLIKASAEGTYTPPYGWKAMNMYDVEIKKSGGSSGEPFPILNLTEYKNGKEIVFLLDAKYGINYAVLRKEGGALKYNPGSNFLSIDLGSTIRWMQQHFLPSLIKSNALSLKMTEDEYSKKLGQRLYDVIKNQFDNLIKTVNNPQSNNATWLQNQVLTEGNFSGNTMFFSILMFIPIKAQIKSITNKKVTYDKDLHGATDSIVVLIAPSTGNRVDKSNIMYYTPYSLISVDVRDLNKPVKDLFVDGSIGLKSQTLSINLKDLKLNVCCDFIDYTADKKKAKIRYSVFMEDSSLVKKMKCELQGKTIEIDASKLADVRIQGKIGKGIIIEDEYEFDREYKPIVEVYLNKTDASGQPIIFDINPKTETDDYVKLNVIVTCINDILRDKKPKEIPVPKKALNCSDLINSAKCIEISKDGDLITLAAYVTLTPVGEELIFTFNEILDINKIGPDATAVKSKKNPMSISTKDGQNLGKGYAVYAKFKIGDKLPENSYVNAIFSISATNPQYDLSALKGPIKSSDFPNEVFYYCTISLDCLKELASTYKKEETPIPPSLQEKKISLKGFCKYLGKTKDGKYKYKYYNYFLNEDLPFIDHIMFPKFGVKKENKVILSSKFADIKLKDKTYKGVTTEYTTKSQTYNPNRELFIRLKPSVSKDFKYYSLEGKKKIYFKTIKVGDKEYLSITKKRSSVCKAPSDKPIEKKDRQLEMKGYCKYLGKTKDGKYKYEYYNYFLDEDLKYVSHVMLPNYDKMKEYPLDKSGFKDYNINGVSYKGFSTIYTQPSKSYKPNRVIYVYLKPSKEFKFYSLRDGTKRYYQDTKYKNGKIYPMLEVYRTIECKAHDEPVSEPKPTPTPISMPMPLPIPEVTPSPTPVEVLPSNISPIQVPINFKPDGGAMEVPIKFKPMSISELPVSPTDTVKQTSRCIIVIKPHQGRYLLPPGCPFDRMRSCFRIPGGRAGYAKPPKKKKRMPDININVVANTGDMRRREDRKPYFNVNSQNTREYDNSRYNPYYNQPSFGQKGKKPLTVRDKAGRQYVQTPTGLKQVSDVVSTQPIITGKQPSSNKGFWILLAIVGVIGVGALADGNLFEDFTRTVGKAKRTKW